MQKQQTEVTLNTKRNLNLNCLNEKEQNLLRLIYEYFLRLKKSAKKTKRVHFRLKPKSETDYLSETGEREEGLLTEYERKLLRREDCSDCCLSMRNPNDDHDEIVDYSDDLKQLFKDEYQSNQAESSSNKFLMHLVRVQKDLMPSWTEIDPDQQQNMKDLTKIWLNNLNKHFDAVTTNKKQLRSLILNQKRLSQEPTRLDLNELIEKRLNVEQANLYKQLYCLEKSTSITTTANVKNCSRLILKFNKQFIDAFDCLNQMQQQQQSYWKSLNVLMNHLLKATLRATYYIHIAANLNKLGLTYPTTYLIESDDSGIINGTIQLDDVHKYLYLIFFQMKNFYPFGLKVSKSIFDESSSDGTNDSANRRPSPKKQPSSGAKLKKSRFKQLAASFIRVIRLCSLMRDSLTMKQLLNSNCIEVELNIYAKYLLNEHELIIDLLKSINQ